MSKWPTISKVGDNCCTSGGNKTDAARSANRKSPNSLDGITITWFGDPTVAAIPLKTGCCFILIAIVKSITWD
jgi:hypothetical protein